MRQGTSCAYHRVGVQLCRLWWSSSRREGCESGANGEEWAPGANGEECASGANEASSSARRKKPVHSSISALALALPAFSYWDLRSAVGWLAALVSWADGR